jgi:hypothetical protein
MLATTSGQVGFFDAAVLARPLPSRSFFALLAEHGDRIVRDEDFAACYSPGMGRPSIPPSLLAKVRKAGFDGDLVTRISVLGRGSTRNGPTEEVPR